MTPSDASRANEAGRADEARRADEPSRPTPGVDAIEGLGQIVSRGHAAVTVLMKELREGLSTPFEVRPIVDESSETWAADIADALGEVRGRIVAVASERPGVAARITLGLAARLVDAGSPVTIVDGSIEEPLFAKGLPDDGEEGLVDAVLFGVSSSTVARRTLMHGVRLVTAGSYPISVPAVLGADAYATTLQKLAREDATVLLVLPAGYASVAATSASQLVVAAQDLPALERLTRDLRASEDLRDVRFVAVLSAPEPVYAAPDAAGVADDAPVLEGTAGAPRVDGESGVDIEPEPESEPHVGVEAEVASGGVDVPDEHREPTLVTAHAAGPSEETRAEEKRPSGRRWGGLITIVLILVVAGVAWRSGVFDALFTPSGRTVADIATTDAPLTPEVRETPDDDRAVPVGGSEETALDGGVDAASTEGGTAPVVAEDSPPAVGERGAGDSDDVTGAGDWRSRAALPAVERQYVVFTSSHRYETAAERDAATLERRGFPAVVVRVNVPDRGTWHRVAVDAGFRTLDDTRELLDIMKEVGYEGAWIERLRTAAPPEPDEPVVPAERDTSERWIDGNS